MLEEVLGLSMTLYLISYLSYVYFPTCTLKQSENAIKNYFYLLSGPFLVIISTRNTKDRKNLVLIVWLYWFKSKPYGQFGYTLNRSDSVFKK